jgi:hypothetical protein
VQALVVEATDVLGDGDLEVVDALPGSLAADQLGRTLSSPPEVVSPRPGGTAAPRRGSVIGGRLVFVVAEARNSEDPT